MNIVIKELKRFRVEIDATTEHPERKIRNWCAHHNYVVSTITEDVGTAAVKSYSVDCFYNIQDYRKMGREVANEVLEDKHDISDITL
jgi:hypothetical protein